MEVDAENLGDLELAALDYLWRNGAADVETVHGAVAVEREITYNTVQSALKRLWEKGLLERYKQSYAYIYEPAVERSELAEHRVSEVVEELAGGRLDAALEAFVDFADRAGEEQLDRLEALIDERRSEDEE